MEKGTATITIKADPINVKKTITIKVTNSTLSKSSNTYKSTGAVGTASATMHQSINSGYTYGNVQTAYLNARSDGTFERVEYIRGSVVREVYDSSYRLKSRKRSNANSRYLADIIMERNTTILYLDSQIQRRARQRKLSVL